MKYQLSRFFAAAGMAMMSVGIFVEPIHAQVEGSQINLRRGALWTSFYYGKECIPFTNWARLSYGLDWPGFDPEWIGANVGGAASYTSTGGMWVAAKDDSGKIISVEDWAMYAGGVLPDASAKYIVTTHRLRWKNGENFWRQADPNEAEEVIDTRWEMNPNYVPQYTGDRQIPVRVTRTVRQWAGSQLDENYVIVDYTIKNISDTMRITELYSMLTYSLSPNSRGWYWLFPNYNQGPRNVLFNYNPSTKAIACYAEDFPGTDANEKYDFYPNGGPLGKGEYLAPGYTGFRLLYSSPDSTGAASRVNKWAWVAAPDQQDLYGPFGSASAGLEARYNIVKDPTTASEAVTGFVDNQRLTRRRWSLMTLGPYNMNPHDSIRIAVAEFVAGPSYADSINNPIVYKTDASGNPIVPGAGQIGQAATKSLNNIMTRTSLAFNNNFRLPTPPPSPEYTVTLNTDPKLIANIIKWKNDPESVPDPDYSGSEALDLAGYRVYRSGYLPIGPWVQVADIKKGDPKYLFGSTYTFVDSTVVLGTGYYYAVTSYDKGHSDWPVTPAKDSVPPLESSIYASLYAQSSLDPNLTIRPFRTTIAPAQSFNNVIVVPNPFVLESGSTIPDEKSVIQFINIPNPCTIRIYTIRGDLVKTIRHNDGSGIEFWNQQTDYGQFVGSGVYVYYISDAPSGGTKIGKLAIVR